MARILFGLEAQGLIPEILQMMKDGMNWQQIADAISWDRKTLRVHWRRFVEKIDDLKLGEMEDFVFRNGHNPFAK
jgi:hypothetical protein